MTFTLANKYTFEDQIFFMLCVFFFGIYTSGFNGDHLAREKGEL